MPVLSNSRLTKAILWRCSKKSYFMVTDVTWWAVTEGVEMHSGSELFVIVVYIVNHCCLGRHCCLEVWFLVIMIAYWSQFLCICQLSWSHIDDSCLDNILITTCLNNILITTCLNNIFITVCLDDILITGVITVHHWRLAYCVSRCYHDGVPQKTCILCITGV